MHLFHVPELGMETEELPPDEAHHAMHVLRLAPGIRITLVDGSGGSAEAELVEVTKRGCRIEILNFERRPAERRSTIHLAVAPTKQMDRFEWFLEKAVEIGVDRITPLITQRSERTRMRYDRARKVMVAAMKQSQRRWLPELSPITSLSEFIASSHPDQRYFGWCQGEHPSFMDRYRADRDALVIIGPEGDLSEDEADFLMENGYQAVGIGSSRLRTETAALAACTWMSLAQQR